MEMNLDLEEIILYLNANEPTGKYCKNIENLKNALIELKAIKESNPSKALKDLEIIGEAMLKYRNKVEEVKVKCIISPQFESIRQALLKAQEQEKENARLKEILINGFRDKNGVFHKETYLAFVDDEWCICDLNTDEWFLAKEVL